MISPRRRLPSPKFKTICAAPASHLTLTTSSLSAPSFPKGTRKRKVGRSDSICSMGIQRCHRSQGSWPIFPNPALDSSPIHRWLL
jgi:hypothetical protein